MTTFTLRAMITIFLFTSACATNTQNREAAETVSRSITIMVDASTINKTTLGRDDFNIDDNKALAEFVAATAKAAIESRGMMLAEQPRTSFGARIAPNQRLKLLHANGTKNDAPETASPPFGVNPDQDDKTRAGLNDLYRGLLPRHSETGLTPPSPPSHIPPDLLAHARGNGVLVVICEGHSPSAGSRAAAVGTTLVSVLAATAGGSGKIEGEFRAEAKAEIFLLDRNSGAVLWHDEENGHDLDSGFFSESVKRMLGKLPKTD